jgi:hypothetical protein
VLTCLLLGRRPARVAVELELLLRVLPRVPRGRVLRASHRGGAGGLSTAAGKKACLFFFFERDPEIVARCEAELCRGKALCGLWK